jgi:hypothetical protein
LFALYTAELTVKFVTGLVLPETWSRAPFLPTPCAYVLFNAAQFENTRAAASRAGPAEPADGVTVAAAVAGAARAHMTIAIAIKRLVDGAIFDSRKANSRRYRWVALAS